MFRHIAHKARDVARRHVGRIVYVVEYPDRKIGYLLYLRHGSKIRMLASMSSSGELTIVRH